MNKPTLAAFKSFISWLVSLASFLFIFDSHGLNEESKKKSQFARLDNLQATKIYFLNERRLFSSFSILLNSIIIFLISSWDLRCFENAYKQPINDTTSAIIINKSFTKLFTPWKKALWSQ